MICNVSLHLLRGGHKMIVASVHFVLTPGTGCVGHAGAKSVWKLAHEVVVDAVFERAQDDHGAGELQVDLLHRLVSQDLGQSVAGTVSTSAT
jgi:hypothetical protein